jgi:hypothetical protein
MAILPAQVAAGFFFAATIRCDSRVELGGGGSQLGLGLRQVAGGNRIAYFADLGLDRRLGGTVLGPPLEALTVPLLGAFGSWHGACKLCAGNGLCEYKWQA